MIESLKRLMLRLLTLSIFFLSMPVLAEEVLQTTAASLVARYPEHKTGVIILVDISRQQILLFENGKETDRYSISTSSYGIGSKSGSNKTPLGAHFVRKKIGAEAAPGTIFKARKNTGKIAQTEYKPRATGDDFVTSRILWLSGLERGINKAGNVDSFKRYIYIHGTHEEGLIGQPASHGCVRMKNEDVIELFDHTPESSLVLISEDLTARGLLTK